MARSCKLPQDDKKETTDSWCVQNGNAAAYEVLYARLQKMCLDANHRQVQCCAIAVQDPTISSTGPTRATTSSPEQGVDVTTREHAGVDDGQAEGVERMASPTRPERSGLPRLLSSLLLTTRKSWCPPELALMVQRVYYFSKGKFNYKEDMCSSPTELCGYSVRLGLGCWKDTAGHIVLMFFLQLCESPKDPTLEWPFCTTFTFKIVHPNKPREDVELSIGAREMARAPASFAMPRRWRNNVRFQLGDSFSVTTLAQKGFWKEGTLQIRVELTMENAMLQGSPQERHL